MAAAIRLALLVAGAWTLVSVIVAVPIAALFKAQVRADEAWRRREWRRAWLEASRVAGYSSCANSLTSSSRLSTTFQLDAPACVSFLPHSASRSR